MPKSTSAAHSVELFGAPRLLAGVSVAEAAGGTLGELAADLARRLPALAGPVLDPDSGWPNSGYCFVVGERFTRDPTLPLIAGIPVILVASVAGG
jgi:molybdopterin converting factor small subunit